VYAWGGNEHGQLGVGVCSAYRSEPCEVVGGLCGGGVMAISCGLFHSAAVTDGGLLFTVRDSFPGVLIQKLNDDFWIPVVARNQLGSSEHPGLNLIHIDGCNGQL